MSKKFLFIATGLLLVITVFAGHLSGANAQEGEQVWAAWENKDISTLGDDNTGSTFALSEEVLSPAGIPALQVTPGGTSEETKLAFPVLGADLEDWAAYSQVVLEVYLPEDNALNANRFFMGMADVTGEFAWIGGVFSETQAQPGWNRIVFKPDASMRQPKPDANKINIYLSFFYADEGGAKTPLTEPFYLGNVILAGAEKAAAPTETGPVIWKAWEQKNPGMLGDDNTGTDFAQSADILTPAGNPSLQIIPSGTAEETKLAFPVSGANLQDWITHGQVELEVYLPPENALNPNRVFMGMGDITGEWAWAGGTWGEFQGDSGWTRAVFLLDPQMQKVNTSGAYFVYLAFMHADEKGNKTALTEPLYLGSIYLSVTTAEGEGKEAAAALPAETVWTAWENKDIGTLGDDNTGSTFALSEEVLSPTGIPSLQMTPGGTAEETKLAFPISAADLQEWTAYTKVELEVYLPPENTLNPNRFFMGMGDVTGEWAWVGGIFGSTTQLQTGWNRIVYEPLQPMRTPQEGGSYILYLSFFYEDAGAKTPLTEPFYLGSAYLTGLETPAVAGEYSPEEVYQREVDLLLSLDDVGLLDAVAHETFDYFWYEANPTNGLIKDRSTPDSPSSIAAVGFGLAAIPVGVDRGWITYDQGYERALTTLKTFAEGGVQGEHGFFYHFVDMQTGERVWSSELSSIDTALFISGALTAGKYFRGTEVEALANQLYEQIDWQWMMANGTMVSMGWKPDIGFLSAFWDHFDESLLLYALAIGSPTYPVPAEAWDNWKRPVNTAGEYIYLPGEPLFVYQYPLAYLDLRNREDAYANYFNNAIRACERNRQFAIDNAEAFATYQDGVWGLSASDGPRGYKAYGAGGLHDGTIAPYASIACLPFTPEAAFESMRSMLGKYGTKVWREYGFVSAINAEEDWYSTEHIGIDQGDILLMITNYQDGLVWELFMQNEAIQNALVKMGFVEKESDYAVTPAYLEAAKAAQ